jgi:hypothetical protein
MPVQFRGLTLLLNARCFTASLTHCRPAVENKVTSIDAFAKHFGWFLDRVQ